MKSRLLLLPLAFLTVVALLMIPTCQATVVTFDELSERGTGSFLPDGYQGLVWSNFSCANAILITNLPLRGVNGFYYGMVSASNVTYNRFGDPAEIDSLGTNFNFLSAYLTGAWNSNLNIQVQGFSGGNLLYDQTVVASATNPTLFAFNYFNIDRLYFNSFGGQDAGFSTVFSGEHFVLDNFGFEFVPEPSTVVLTAAGGLLLWPFLKRKRV